MSSIKYKGVCNSRLAVTVCDLRKQPIGCNSHTNSIVWMKEEGQGLKEDYMSNKSVLSVRTLTVTAMFTAVSYVLYLFGFKIPIVPSFLTMDFSELPAVIASLSLGPVSGVLVCLLKNVLHLAISHTMWVGELSNFILGVAFVLPIGIIYKKNKTKKGAVIALISGAVIMAAVSVVSNYFIVYPLYDKLAFPMEVIVGMYTALLPSVKSLLPALLIFNVPFTLVKALVSVVVTLLIYKPLSPIIKGTYNK